MPIIGPIDPGGLARSLKQTALSVTGRFRPDHQAIQRRNVRFSNHGMGKLYLYQAVAPSRWSERAYDDAQVSRAVSFIATAFPGVFDDESGKPQPEGANTEWTRFQVNDASGYPDQYVFVHPTGLIEVQWALAENASPDGNVVLDAMEIAILLMCLARAVESQAYTDLSNLGRRPWRRMFSRVDWHFDLALRVVGASGQTSWKELRFAVPSPPRTTQDWVEPPPGGYGGDRVWSVRRRADPTALVEAVLRDLASASGYYDFSEAVAATVRAAAQRFSADRVS